MYKLTSRQLLIDTTDSYFSGDPKAKEPVIFHNDTLPKEEFIKAQAVRSGLPETLLASNDKEFGHPDSYDQGGIFIPFKVDNNLKTFRINTDLDQVPPELRDYAKLIMNITGFKPL